MKGIFTLFSLILIKKAYSQCSNGQYQDVNGCVDCVSGTYDDDSNPSTACENCGAGQYSPAKATACTDCAAGTNDHDSNPSTACENCDTGQYSPAKATACTDCAAGTNDNDSDPSTVCANCDIGQYSPAKATACTDCAAGTNDNDSDPSTVCANCAAGKYQNQVGKESCINCPLGKYNPNEGAKSSGWCVDCSAGSIVEVELSPNRDNAVAEGGIWCLPCHGGKYSSASHINCANCTPGKYSTVGAISCTNCIAGKYQDGDGKTECKDCADGKYQDTQGSISCKDCLAGNELEGKTSCAQCSVGKADIDSNATTPCEQCAVGQFSQGVGAETCEQCPAGQFQNETGSIECKDCPATYYQPASSSELCILCPPGSIAGDGTSVLDNKATHCTVCEIGRFSTSSNVDCDDCPNGFVQPLAGNSSCTKCESGFFDDNNEICAPCEVGTYSQRKYPEDITICVPCPIGKYSNTLSTLLCTVCPAGKYQDNNGTVACKNCAAGKFLYSQVPDEELHDEESDCQTCPNGTSSAAGSEVCSCPNTDGSNPNPETCLCSSNVCVNEPFCYEIPDRCSTIPNEINIGAEWMPECSKNGFEQHVLTSKCWCGSGANDTRGKVCNRFDYCKTEFGNINTCDSNPECSETDNISPNIKACVCRKESDSTVSNTCDSVSGKVCDGHMANCAHVICQNRVSSTPNMAKCTCKRDPTVSTGPECAANTYCFWPYSEEACTNPNYPDCGCSDGEIETCLSQHDKADGTTPNFLADFCSCTDALCRNGEFCNFEFSQCSTTQIPSCKYKDGIKINTLECLCGNEKCGPKSMCSPERLSNKCHKTLCSQQLKIDPKWCDKIDGYGNGVYENRECQSFDCNDDDRIGCCKPCVSGFVWDYKCRQRCPPGFCTGEFIEPPPGTVYENDMRMKLNVIDYVTFLDNYEYTGYCENTTCHNKTDIKTCCIPAKKCSADVCKSKMYGSGFYENKFCGSYICSEEECCVPTQCNCTNGIGKTGKECMNPEENICETCNDGYWLNNDVCIAVKDCQTNQYQKQGPLPNKDRVCYYKSVCKEDQFIEIQATNISDRNCESLKVCNASANEYISKDSEYIYEMHGTTNFTIRATNIECGDLNICLTTQYEDINPVLLNGQYQNQRICKNITQCNSDTQYESNAPTATSDRQCVNIKNCSDVQYESKASTATSDRQCANITQCNSTSQYESKAPTATSDRQCGNIKDCLDTEYQTKAPNETSNRECAITRVCLDTEYQTKAPNETSDRECTAATVCNTTLLQYEFIPKNITTDRQCKTCLANESECIGCTTTSDCEFNSQSNIHNETACSKKTCTRYRISEHNISRLLKYGEWFRFEPEETNFLFTIDFAGEIVQKDNYQYFYIDIDYSGSVSINNQTLPIQQDCQYEFLPPGQCSNQCGSGTRISMRGKKIKDSVAGGKPCSEIEEYIIEPCEENRCIVNCAIVWADFGTCNAPCGKTGVKYRNYTVISQPENGGTPCPPLQQASCITEPDEGYCTCTIKKDACGVCGGDNTTCTGCDGVIELNPAKRKIWNECDECSLPNKPCFLKHSKTDLKRKQFRSDVLKIALPSLMFISLVAILSAVFYTIIANENTRKDRKIYLT